MFNLAPVSLPLYSSATSFRIGALDLGGGPSQLLDRGLLLGRQILHGFVLRRIRITSYNVCYTKLLRYAATPPAGVDDGSTDASVPPAEKPEAPR